MDAPMKHRIHPDLINLATPIEAVRINPANTNTHPERQLVSLEAMLTEFGQRAPLIVRRSTGVLEAAIGDRDRQDPGRLGLAEMGGVAGSDERVAQFAPPPPPDRSSSCIELWA